MPAKRKPPANYVPKGWPKGKPRPGAKLNAPPRRAIVTVDQLTTRQRMFVAYYLGEAKFDATKAASMAGYGTPSSASHKLKTHPAVKAAIEAKLDQVGLTVDEVLANLSDMAAASIDDVINSRGQLDLAKARRNGRIACIKTINFDYNGKVRSIEMYGRDAALDRLARIRRMYADEVKVGVQIDVDVIAEAHKIREARRARGKP
jgi:hypothetical protein